MPCEVSHVPDTNTVMVVAHGKVTSQDALQANEKASHLLIQNGAAQVLADYSDAVSELATLDIHALPEYSDNLGVPKNIRIALVVPSTKYRVEDFQFYGTVCRNRGYNCKIFGSREAAAKWLDGGETA